MVVMNRIVWCGLVTTVKTILSVTLVYQWLRLGIVLGFCMSLTVIWWIRLFSVGWNAGSVSHLLCVFVIRRICRYVLCLFYWRTLISIHVFTVCKSNHVIIYNTKMRRRKKKTINDEWISDTKITFFCMFCCRFVDLLVRREIWNSSSRVLN